MELLVETETPCFDSAIELGCIAFDARPPAYLPTASQHLDIRGVTSQRGNGSNPSFQLVYVSNGVQQYTMASHQSLPGTFSFGSSMHAAIRTPKAGISPQGHGRWLMKPGDMLSFV